MAVKHEPEILVLHPGVQIWGSLVCRTNVTDVYAFDFSTAAAPVQKHVRGTVQYCTDVDGDSELTEFNELQCSVHSLTLHFLPEFSSQSFPVL